MRARGQTTLNISATEIRFLGPDPQDSSVDIWTAISYDSASESILCNPNMANGAGNPFLEKSIVNDVMTAVQTNNLIRLEMTLYEEDLRRENDYVLQVAPRNITHP